MYLGCFQPWGTTYKANMDSNTVISLWNSFRFPYLIACDKCLFSFMRNSQNVDCFPILPGIRKRVSHMFTVTWCWSCLSPWPSNGYNGTSPWSRCVFFKWLSVLEIFLCVYLPSFVLFGEISAQVLCPSLRWVTYVATLMYIWDRVSPHSPGWHSPGWPQTHNTVLASRVLELQVCPTRTHLNCWFLSCWSLRVIFIRMHFDSHGKRSR